MFGVGVVSLAGVLLAGPNTREVDLVPDAIEGEGVVDLAIDRLALLPGTYDLAASIYDYTCQHPYDHRHRVLRFDVETGVPRQVHGLVALGGAWTVDGATATTHPQRVNIVVATNDALGERMAGPAIRGVAHGRRARGRRPRRHPVHDGTRPI